MWYRLGDFPLAPPEFLVFLPSFNPKHCSGAGHFAGRGMFLVLGFGVSSLAWLCSPNPSLLFLTLERVQIVALIPDLPCNSVYCGLRALQHLANANVKLVWYLGKQEEHLQSDRKGKGTSLSL